ncbi:MAG TPA: imidazolonepropionase [Bacillota bacterium]|nr:imidazolonepropionase [Bacillota bacterium]
MGKMGAGFRPRTEPSDLLIIHAAELGTCRARAAWDNGRPEPGPRLGADLGCAGIIEDGAIAVRDGVIVDIGATEEVLSREPEWLARRPNGAGQVADFPEAIRSVTEVFDASGRTVVPGFVDAHTHLVYAGSRYREHLMRLEGAEYLDILKAGGGILATLEATRKASFDELLELALKRLDVMLLHGTTTVEAKSGYGLDLDTELKQLRVARAACDDHPIEIVSTFMGAHAVPPEFTGDPDGYIDFMIAEVLPQVAEGGLAEFCDVFCEEGVFSVEQSRRVLMAGLAHGLCPKMHADEIYPIGGAELAGELGAASADHLAAASKAGMESLAHAGVVAVLLPGTMFTLMSERYANAREMINLGVPVALATDYNPGTSPVMSMQFVMTLACLKMGMTPQEALCAATANAAYAVGRGGDAGVLRVGAAADFIVCDVPAVDALPFSVGVNPVTDVFVGGVRVVSDRVLPY